MILQRVPGNPGTPFFVYALEDPEKNLKSFALRECFDKSRLTFLIRKRYKILAWI
jgi:hypothetical protein